MDTIQYNKKRHERIGELAARLNWHGKLDLLEQALTHPTYFEGHRPPGEYDNQRLEFLGDSIVGFIVARELFKRNPDADEGYLSKTRAALVCEGSLADLARELKLDEYIVMGKGSLKNGEQHRNSILADAFEAVVGAMYLSLGLAAVEEFLLVRFTEELEAKIADRYEDYKGHIQMLVQTLSERKVSYPLISADGPPHMRTFKVGLVYCGQQLACGVGASKKEAEQRAAREAWMHQDEWFPAYAMASKKNQ